MKPRPWHPSRPTKKMVRAAFEAQRPLDAPAKVYRTTAATVDPIECAPDGSLWAGGKMIGGPNKRPVLKPNYGRKK